MSKQGSTLTPEDVAALKMVKLGYAVDDPSSSDRCPDFRVTFTTYAGAAEALRAIGQCRGFDGEAVAQMLDQLPAGPEGEEMRVSIGYGGPGEGYRGVPFLYGRWPDGYRGSPVVYVFDIAGVVNIRTVARLLESVGADHVGEATRSCPSRIENGRAFRAWWV